ncbi:MAG: Slp family lipoprotein [Xanthomonadaceae bacterium]|nr:Slp family lipoprotein [Xanthomonadaceae bacterium]
MPAALLGLAACAPAPIYKSTGTVAAATPAQVAQAPERYRNDEVIWGGRIVKVDVFSDHSEIELLAYPLDSSQRPRANDSGNGRFIAVARGYLEPLSYPAGALMTIDGKLDGTRAGKVGEADYVFPLVEVSQSHVWTPAEMSQGRSNIQFGLGVGVGIH